MKKIVALLLFLIVPITYAVGPRAWGKSGTATTSNAQVTVGASSSTGTFYPASLCIDNEDSTNNLYVNWVTGVASTTDNADNIRIKANTSKCFNFNNPNVSNTMVIGLITNASTVAYNIVAIGYR